MYYDIAVAEAAGLRTLPAPATYLGTSAFLPGRSHPVFSEPVDWTPALNHGLANVLDGGTSIHYEREIFAGDVLTARSHIAQLDVKESKRLGTMLVVTTVVEYRDDDADELVAALRTEVIFY
jgi:hypothetical protein